MSRDTENQPESETSTDGVQIPEPGQLELDMAEVCCPADALYRTKPT